MEITTSSRVINMRPILGRTGPAGQDGVDGKDGLPGVNAVPAVEATAAYIRDDTEATAALREVVAADVADPASEVGAALSATIEPVIEQQTPPWPISSIELLPAVGAGDSFIASASNQLPGTTHVHRLAKRQNLGAYTNYGVGGYRADQVIAKLRAEYLSPLQRAVVAVMVGLNDVGQYDGAGVGVAGAATTAKAFDATLSHVTAQAVQPTSADSLAFDAQWTSNAAGMTAGVGAIVQFAFDGDACDFLVQMVTGSGGTIVVESLDGTTAHGNATTGGYLNGFSGVAVQLRGFGAGVHVVRARVTAGTVTVTGLAIPSPQPPLVIWWQYGRPQGQSLARYELMTGTYFPAMQAVADTYPSVVTVTPGENWDPEAMTCFDTVHCNSLGNGYYCTRAEKVLREREAAGLLPDYLGDPAPATYSPPSIEPWPEIVTPVVNDTFTDTTGTALTAHTGETGATWSNLTGFTGTMLVTPDGRVRKGDTNTVAVVAAGTPASADYAVEADVTIRSAIGGQGTSIGLRMLTSGGVLNAYEVRFVPGATPWRITKRTGATTSDLGTATGNATVGATYPLRGRAENVDDGVRIRVYIGQTLILDATDTTSPFTAAGKAGIVSTGGASSDTTGVHIDNFRAGPLA